MRALVLGGLALIAATYGLARFGYGLFLPEISTTIELTPIVSGLVQAGSFLSYCVAAAAATAQAGRPRRIVVLAGGTAAVGSTLVAAAPDALVLAVGVVVAGAGAGFATPGLVTMIQLGVPAGRRESAQTIVNAGTGAGIVVAGLLLLAVADQWRLAWASFAAIALTATIAVLRAERAAAAPAEAERSPTARSRIAGLRPLAAPIVAALLAGASSAAVWTFGASVLTEDGGSAVAAWLALGALGMLGAAAAKVVQRWSLRAAWALTSLAMAASTVLLGVASGAPAIAAAALFGASYTALSGVLLLWAVRIEPARGARGTVVLFIALAIGQAIGAPVIGVLIDASSPALAFSLAGAVGVLSLLPALRGGERRDSSTAEIRLAG